MCGRVRHQPSAVCTFYRACSTRGFLKRWSIEPANYVTDCGSSAQQFHNLPASIHSCRSCLSAFRLPRWGRNPLEALGHLTFLTLNEPDISSNVRKYMLLAEEQMASLCRIANEALGFAHRWDKPKAVDLVALADAAVRIHQRTIEEKRIHLVRELPVQVMAEVHPGETLHFVSNLIVNALEALPANGTLRLRLRRRQDKLDFLIADGGHGIAPSHSDAIFQPFFTTKGDHGTGLGLALSKRIVEHHGGRIRVRSSVRPGKSGTAFKTSLPVA